MMDLPKKLITKINARKENNSLRVLKTPSHLVDFSSNDYLGFAKSEVIFDKTHQFLVDKNIKQNGATGSRLLSGNHLLYNEVESFLSDFHKTESATIFNSGYDANIGFFAAVPQKGDLILYDEFIHASIRDGIKLSNAKAFKFKHNDLEDLENRLLQFHKKNFSTALEVTENNKRPTIYVITESVFSMDGDTPDLVKISEISRKHNAFLIVDEAHAVGVFGENGCGIVQALNIQNAIFARIITFGKALGCHGAAILGSATLQTYLVNFARSFIYTTGLSPHSLATIQMSYNALKRPFDCVQGDTQNQEKLQENIHHFIEEIKRLGLNFIPSNSAIHCCIISGNENIKLISENILQQGFEVKAILSPTVPEGKERLRFCLHSYNTTKEITDVLGLLCKFIDE